MIAGLLVAAAIDAPGSHRIAVAPAETLTVTIAGEGPPVLLLPGLFGGAYGFRNVVPLLVADGFRTIVIEPLGLGESSRPAHADYSLTVQAERVAAVLDTLGERSVLIAAHSLGAAIAFRIAYRRPDLVAGIVSIESGPTEEIGTPAFRHAMRRAPLIRLVGGIGFMRHEVRRELEGASGNRQWITDDVVNGYTAGAAQDLGGTVRALRAMAHAREPEPLAPHLGALTCPVRLLVGTAPHDGGVDSADVQALRQLRSFVLVPVPGAGHYLQEEQPAAVAAEVCALEEQRNQNGSARREGGPCASR